jgi:hypothetical protein
MMEESVPVTGVLTGLHDLGRKAVAVRIYQMQAES